MVGVIFPGEGGRVDVDGLYRGEERLVSKFKQFGDARISLFAAIQFLALFEKVGLFLVVFAVIIIIIIIIRNLYIAIMPLGGYRGAGGTGR